MKIEPLNQLLIFIRSLTNFNNVIFVTIYPVTNVLFIQFQFVGTATNQLTLPWEDLAVLRKDYLNSDIFGESNAPLFNTLDIINTLDKGAANAVKSTANLRGILKSTKAMLSPDDVRR